MAASAVKARIHAFEAMQASTATVVASRSPPDLLETPISPTATSITPIIPSTPSTSFKSMSPSPSPSPPNLGRKTSLIDLKDWVVDDGPLPYVPRQRPPIARKPPPPLTPKPTSRHASPSILKTPPLISLDSPPKSRPAPPLPPRQASYSSSKSVSPTNPLPPSLSRNSSAAAAPARSSSDSLTVDHTYPPLSQLGINIPSRHVSASSISSFHSVSLSSDGGTDPTTPGTAVSFSTHIATYSIDHDDHDVDRGSIREPDAISLDESFEHLSVTSAVSPSISSVSYDWEVYPKRAPEPPKLPQRPARAPTSAPTSPRRSPVLVPKRDVPIPPPPRPPSSRTSLASTSAASTSDRSSILSVATSRTSLSSATKPILKTAQLTRPTPVPHAARKRYEVVFNGNVIAARQVQRATSPPPIRKARQAAGWRGLSVDLITNPEEIASKVGSTMRPEPIDEEPGADDRLDGETVRAIWKLSRLGNDTLRVIWMECDPTGAGSLGRDGFVKGMWRIDEELRRAQLHKHLAPRPRVRQPKATHPPKPILR